LFLCLTFASLFTLVERVAPGSFSGMFEGQPRFSSLAYFSLVTLTTLGYGDITPATRFAESLVILESVCGLLYPTVVVARLVSLYMLGESPAAPRTERSAGALPVMVLAGLLVVTPLAVPWLEQNPGATALERIAIGALLLVCLRAIAVGRRVRFAAAACLALAVGASLWTDPGGRGVVVTLGIALQAGLLTWVIVLLTRWTFQQERVKDGVLIGSLCLLLLTGFDFALFFEVALRLSPGALVMEGEPSFARLSYFSFMTLTTTGFGDITPGIPAVRALAVIESTIGIFYPAIVLARLVSLYRSSE
jgi:voltage-gated potassium channel Kch